MQGELSSLVEERDGLVAELEERDVGWLSELCDEVSEMQRDQDADALSYVQLQLEEELRPAAAGGTARDIMGAECRAGGCRSKQTKGEHS